MAARSRARACLRAEPPGRCQTALEQAMNRRPFSPPRHRRSSRKCRRTTPAPRWARASIRASWQLWRRVQGREDGAARGPHHRRFDAVSKIRASPIASPFSIRRRSTPSPCPAATLCHARLLALANDASEVAAVLSHEMRMSPPITASSASSARRREVIASRVVSEVLSATSPQGGVARGKLRSAASRATRSFRPTRSACACWARPAMIPMRRPLPGSHGRLCQLQCGGPGKRPSMDFPVQPSERAAARRSRPPACTRLGPEGTTAIAGATISRRHRRLLYGDSPQRVMSAARPSFTQARHPFRGARGLPDRQQGRAVLATGPGESGDPLRWRGRQPGPQPDRLHRLRLGHRLEPDTIRATQVNGLEAATARASADRWDFDVT